MCAPFTNPKRSVSTIRRVEDWTRWALDARDGDERSWRRLVEASQPHVWRLCAHLGDREAADDLTQETYLRAIRSLRSYRGAAPVRVWLFAIARRVVADDIAARRKRRTVDQSLLAASYLQQHPDHAESSALIALLADLDPDRREAFVITQVLGFSYADAAAIAGCPVGTIRSRVARAREELATAVRSDERSA